MQQFQDYQIKETFYRKYGKRMLDFILSVSALAFLSPLFLLIALLVRLNLGSPVIFKQIRAGLNKRSFTLYKFRSMTTERDCNGIYFSDEKRLVPFGKIIRRTSIDELPSLINIACGHMSIIGPRPLPIRYLSRYTIEQLRRFQVRPGLSSPAVLKGRNMLTWEDQFKHEVCYVEDFRIGMDVKCILKTIKMVFSTKGATSSDGGARKEFIGKAKIYEIQDARSDYIKL